MERVRAVELPISKVRFVEDRVNDRHEYWLGFELLNGVTSILDEMLFSGKYNGISKSVLDNAANRGTAIHEAVQAYELGLDYVVAADLINYEADAIKAAKAWASYRSGVGNKYSRLVTAYSEYLVSNEKDIATKIDLTMYDDGWYIGDIKTTSKLDKEYLRWQLSFEAYLFEHQTGQKIKGLFAMWYDRKNNQWIWIEIERISDAEIEKLISDWRAYKGGNIFAKPAEEKKEEKELPAPIVELGKLIAGHESKMKALKAQSDEFKTRLLSEMKKYGIMQIKTDDCTISYVAPSTKQQFNKDLALEKYPDLAKVEGIYSTSNVKESLRITLK